MTRTSYRYNARVSRLQPAVWSDFGSLAFLALVFLFLAPFAFSQSVESYTYPGTTPLTEFTIGNINAQSVSVSISYYASGGTLTQNTILLEPGKQTRFTGASLGILTAGTTVISAGLPLAVSATVSEARSFEHLSPTEAGTDLVLPFAGFAGSSTVVSVFNPGESSAGIRLVSVGEDGLQTSFRNVTIGPKETIQETLSSDATLGNSYAVIRSGNILLPGQPVMAAAAIRSFTPPSGVAGTRFDGAHVTGRPLIEEGNSARIPLFISGEDFFSVLQVINNENAAQEVLVTALAGDGNPIESANNPATIEVAARGTLSEALSVLLEFDDVDLSGSVVVEGASRLSANLVIGHVSQPGLAMIASDPSTTNRFVYHTRRVGRDFFLILNLINSSDEMARLDLDFILDDGATVSTTTLDLPPSTQTLGSLASILSEAQGDGFLLVRSTAPIRAGGLEGRADSSVLSPLMALPAAADYTPPLPTESLISGTVLANGVGLENVSVLLNGPVSQTILTDRVGTFVFPDVPPGAYSIATQAIGYTISPSERTMTLTDANSQRNDFNASLSLPAIETFSPTEVPVRSGNTEIVVRGGPFLRGSRVYFETTALQTVFIDSSELRANLSSGLLTFPSEADLFVRNTDPSGQTVDSLTVRFRVGTAPPLISELSGHPNPLIAGSAGFTLTLTGTGFFPGVVVFADDVPLATTFVLDTELRVTISAEVLANGGFLSITASNPGPTVRSAEVLLPVVSLPPTINQISPDAAQVRLGPDLPPLAMEVRGSGFLDGAVVLMDGAIVATTFVSRNVLVASVPAIVLSRSGIRVVQVRNPDPTLADSFAVPFTLNTPLPVLTSITGTATFGSRSGEVQNVPLLLNGENFSPDSVAWAMAPCDTDLADDKDDANTFKALSTTRLTDRIMLINLRVACPGPYSVQVRSPQPGGGVSNTLIVVVPQG